MHIHFNFIFGTSGGISGLVDAASVRAPRLSLPGMSPVGNVHIT